LRLRASATLRDKPSVAAPPRKARGALLFNSYSSA
jgi:hypothetical protein